MSGQKPTLPRQRFSLTALVLAELQKPDEDDPTVTKGQKVAEQILLHAARRTVSRGRRQTCNERW